MTESRYLAEVRRLPRPSAAQIDAFVEYVASAHSWYKHLPLLPLGEPFVFYLDPNAGREWVDTEAGGGYRDRTSDTPERERFHYTWQPTAEYVERFGHLDYFEAAGTSFLVPLSHGVLDTSTAARIRASDGEWVDLPDAIRTAGAVRLTAVIHPLGQEPDIWLGRFGKLGPSPWPGDTALPDRPPDDGVLAAILEIVRRVPSDAESLQGLPELGELTTRWLPAYAREQKERMRGAIGRALQWVYGPS
ncbi:MAG TPA: hypothetical protein VNA89_01495 [Gemmatimonadaceae bacterium]|nr:hypothetical protein [Gemmatimonadaceae bacterium]